MMLYLLACVCSLQGFLLYLELVSKVFPRNAKFLTQQFFFLWGQGMYSKFRDLCM